MMINIIYPGGILEEEQDQVKTKKMKRNYGIKLIIMYQY